MKIETRGRKELLTLDQKKEIIKSYLPVDKMTTQFGVSKRIIYTVLKNRKYILSL